MPELKVIEVRTLSSYAKHVADKPGDMKWFRGVSRASYELVPSLYRHPSINDSVELLQKEAKLVTRFRERAQPMVGRPLPDDRLEMMFLMQHHGMPTRLLDWSENAFIALFFALSNVDKSEDGKSVGASCVWILKPALWNRKVQEHIGYPGDPFSVGDPRLVNGYINVEGGNGLMAKPVAVYGVHNSPRIVSQRGVFTLFGTSNIPMEKVFKEDNFPDDCLTKLEFKGGYQDELFKELVSAGVIDSTVYPDLDGLARELRRSHGYKV